MNSKAIDTLKEALLEDVPMKNGRVDANKHRIQQSKNLKSLILVSLETKDDLSAVQKTVHVVQRTGIVMSVVFSIAIIGIVAGWTFAGAVTVFGTALKGASMLLGKS